MSHSLKKVICASIVIGYSIFHNEITAQSEFIEDTGDVLLYALPLTAISGSLISGDTKGTWQFTKGALLTQGITFGLKALISEERIDKSDNNSFPSGHTSTTFQSAAFIQKRYGWKLGLPAYVLAGYTGYTRMQANKHDGWDVLAGAIIGIGSSYLFTTPYQQEHMELTFSNIDNSFVIGFKYKF